MIPAEERLVVVTPRDPARDAVALALVMSESEDAANEVADELLASYKLSGDVLSLVTHLAFLVGFERDDADEFLYSLALRKANESKGHP